MNVADLSYLFHLAEPEEIILPVRNGQKTREIPELQLYM